MLERRLKREKQKAGVHRGEINSETIKREDYLLESIDLHFIDENIDLMKIFLNIDKESRTYILSINSQHLDN